MSTESTIRQNTLYDEEYNNYVFSDVTINTIEPDHKTPAHNHIPEQYKGAFKSDDYLESWLQQVEQLSVEKKEALAGLLNDYRSAGLIDEYLTNDFVEYFCDVQEEVPRDDNIGASHYITAYFIRNCSKNIELIHYLWSQPWNFEYMFTTYFLPKLMNAGINDIHVMQKTQKEDNGHYLYDLQISSNETTLQINTHGDRDVFAPFVLAINKLLLNKPIKERFIRGIDTGDISYLFIEPAKIATIANKYNMRFVAVRF
jgi:hypothetical protein